MSFIRKAQHHHQLVKAQDASRPRFHDPVTGDPLTLGEEISWVAQGLIRRWTFFALLCAGTFAVWITGHIWDQSPTTIWNLWASWWALVLESIVGIAMFSQTRRDAVKIRQIHRLAQEQRDLAANLDSKLDQLLNHE